MRKVVKIGFEIELDSRLVESTFPEFQPMHVILQQLKLPKNTKKFTVT